MSFLSSVPQSHRPALFQSLLFEACGRTVNPVNGAVGLLWTGNWNLCQSAVDTVLRGGIPRSLPEFSGLAQSPELDEDNNNDLYGSRDLKVGSHDERRGIELRMTAGFPARMTARGRSKRRPASHRGVGDDDDGEWLCVWPRFSGKGAAAEAMNINQSMFTNLEIYGQLEKNR
ncbi:LOB domain-containing protein 37 [Sesamum angolense]|uniref:LOB domain-containing protein 37 n=1 Tax=Sesamum angolense TaxID=2727404 RepID=A0AAE1WXZ9_9LAMI|nr:LOB domain-containing protein 37 [Sesamum angolense]